MSAALAESDVEDLALGLLRELGWQVRHGQEIAPGGAHAEREDYGQVVLATRLRDALARLNPGLSAEVLEEAFRRLTRPPGVELVHRNREAHRMLTSGVTVEYRDATGTIRGALVRAIDFDTASLMRGRLLWHVLNLDEAA